MTAGDGSPGLRKAREARNGSIHVYKNVKMNWASRLYPVFSHNENSQGAKAVSDSVQS